jgi:predicted lipoprotein with Yx(FWY)xxD motif
MTRLLTIATAAGALALAGCGGDDGSSDSSSSGASPYGGGAAATTETTQSTEPEGSGTTIKLAGSQFGRILFGENDQAIYLFEKESGPKSECYGECAAAWPPVLTEGGPRPGPGVKGAKLGVTEREDGGTQVTYNGHPLYYYADEGPGEVTCHNVDEFGGLWLVVDPAGNAV